MQKHSASGMTEALGRVTQNTRKGERELHKAVLVGNQMCWYLITVRSTSPTATFRVRGKAPPPPWRHAISRAPLHRTQLSASEQACSHLDYGPQRRNSRHSNIRLWPLVLMESQVHRCGREKGLKSTS